MNTSRRALRHDVRDGLVRGILEGDLGPGDRLIEMHIAKEYGTSQGPVREALRELEMLGFVRSEPHRGTYVRDPWQRGMVELYELRGALEEFAARMATPTMRHDTGAIQAEVDGMAAAAVRDDVHAAVDHSERFHRLIIEASGNQLLETVWSSLSISNHTALTMVTLSLDLATLAQSHQPIVDAIVAGDIELACRVSREHQAWFEELLAATAKGSRRKREAKDADSGPEAPEPDATSAISA
jgi:DNA-binding GntR family transcriptional regulator